MNSWQAIAKSKQESLRAAIPSEWIIPAHLLPPEHQTDVTSFPRQSGWFTNRELEILSTSAPRILAHLETGSWTSEEVTKVFCKAAAAAHQLTNCLSEILFDEAIARAKQLDEHLRKTGKPKGPFHGLPISLKDNFNIIGKDSTVGFTSLVNDPATYNSTLTDLLLEGGAVLYVKTNVPTAMMIAETVNNVFGRTVNPLNRKLTSGGSSGGESALISFGASRIGVGTDIGGSLRIPAACTGIFTLRPSFGRFPNFQTRSGLAGQEAVNSVNGPMASTLEEITFYSKTVIDQEPWVNDPKCLPIPWRPAEPKHRLKLAVMWNDGIVTPTPPVARALKETVDRLRKAGHEVIDWTPTGHKEARELLQRKFVADGGKSVRGLLAPTGEPFREEMRDYEKATELGVHKMWQIHLERNNLQKDYLHRWNTSGIDGILCPTTPYSSVEHGKFAYVGYTGVFNILDYSAVSFPCGVKASKALDTSYHGHKALSDVDARIQHDCTCIIHTYDNASAVDGMPVSLQLVARRLEEEKVLMMTGVVLQAVSTGWKSKL
ncbi:amidase signature domain-containing protein [Aspergillus pseudocaelatus]|uniref:amidase n=1 Tax=Aspergillus pseudocaelatus TaxID=1825620 RepID=A0ABQ6W5M6_9EURO|nr:amidase signature domain-containing protein [Aspergillus pseudocaelatus]